MYTEHDINIILPPPPPPERKSSLRQVWQMFTSASPANAHFGKSGKCSLRQARQTFTSASPSIVHFGKSGKCSLRQARKTFILGNSGNCSLRQVRQMFTSASPYSKLIYVQMYRISTHSHTNIKVSPRNVWPCITKFSGYHNRIQRGPPETHRLYLNRSTADPGS